MENQYQNEKSCYFCVILKPMNLSKCFLGVLLLSNVVFAQSNYTSGTLIGAGKTEIKLFNNLYCQTQSFDENGNRIDRTFRDTYFTGILTLMHGYSDRVDVGLEAYPKFVRVTDICTECDRVTLPMVSRSALALLAPKIKFKLSNQITAQSTLVIPVGKNMEGGNGEPFLEYDDVQWWNQLYYQKPIGDKLLIFAETGVLFRYDLASDNRVHEWVFPVKLLFQYSPIEKFTAYTLTEIAPSTNQNYYTQVGLGAKYQLSDRFLVEVLGTTFPAGKNKGAGQTLNLGLRTVF